MRPVTDDGGMARDGAGLDSGRTSYLTPDDLQELNLEAAAAPAWLAAAASPKTGKRKPGSPKPGSPKPGSPKPGKPKPAGSPK
jgi:hypothetical protein